MTTTHAAADGDVIVPEPDAPAPPVALGDEPHADDMYARAMRHDGWTAPRRRRFLELIADGYIVDHAARMVGLSATSAYALRRRPAGAAFALGWRAANLVARDHLADTMLERARNGTTETVTRDDGSSIERHRISDRLGLQLLARLDRQADAASAAEATAAQLVAGDFDQYLDLVGDDAGAARAGLFLAAHGDIDGGLADIAALARADRARRAAPPGDVADLDPAERHGWTAEQWCRAEAAGIVALAPEPTATAPQLPQHSAPAPAPMACEEPVWWCGESEDYRTHFPPPDDFDGYESGEWDDPDYERALSPGERRLIGAPAMDHDACLDRAYAESAAWFARYAVPPAAGDPSDERDAGVSLEPEPEPEPEPIPDPASLACADADPVGFDLAEPGTPPPPAR